MKKTNLRNCYCGGFYFQIANEMCELVCSFACFCVERFHVLFLCFVVNIGDADFTLQHALVTTTFDTEDDHLTLEHVMDWCAVFFVFSRVNTIFRNICTVTFNHVVTMNDILHG